MGAATGTFVRNAAGFRTTGSRREPTRRCNASRSPKQMSRDRRSNRQYMREWRANPKNRAKERLRAVGWRWRRKLAQLEARQRGIASGMQCAYCRQAAIMKIDRMRASEDGFRPVVVPYCGMC